MHKTEKTVFSVGDGSTLADIHKTNGIYGERAFRNYRIKVRVHNSQEEMTEFIRFTSEVTKHHKAGTLTVDKDDASTFPSFIIHYPKYNEDDSYFVVKCYTVLI